MVWRIQREGLFLKGEETTSEEGEGSEVWSVVVGCGVRRVRMEGQWWEGVGAGEGWATERWRLSKVLGKLGE